MSTPPLSFERASYAGDPTGPDQCAYCQSTLNAEYFRVGGHLACAPCAQRAQALVPPNTHGAFARSLTFGAAAAMVGCIAYALMVIWTGWTIGYAAIGVGYIIGWAMKRGAHGNGGRRYQIAAAVLTYTAVAMAFIPIAIHQSNEHKTQDTAVSSGATSGKAGQSAAAQPGEKSDANPMRAMITAFATLIGLGLVSPFLELADSFGSGLLTLFIIFIGVRYAWMSMAPPHVTVDGPYNVENAA